MCMNLILFPEIDGCPVNKNCGPRFIIVTSLSLTAIVILVVILVATAAIILVKRMIQRRHNQSTEKNKGVDMAAYEEIELRPPPSATIGTTDNVAYSNVFSSD